MKKTILHLCADLGSDSFPYQNDCNYDVIKIGKKIGVNTVRVGKDNNNLFNEDYSIMKLRELFTITEVNP